jgi:asparagine synthase (glutamine-hydrolysing)
MCGICGVVYADPTRPVERERLTRMTDSIAHRGPDDTGVFLDGHAGLGHRRLSIVDLAAGHQPMANEDESLWIAFNGEIYNHLDLRPGLEHVGHRYRTRSDTETIIHLHEARGVSGAGELRGMFAYALWNRRSRTLTLVRDHTGIKPLYYALGNDGTIVFGSEIKSIAASGLVPIALEHDVIDEYFATGHVSGTRTLLRGIRKLAPGTALTWHEGKLSFESFWKIGTTGPDHAEATRLASSADAARHFWPRFVDSVRSQLMSDVPLGVFLSGGLDSSLIVAAMQAAGATSVKSFSVGYREAEASELPWARLVADALGTEHHEVIVDGADFFEGLADLTWHRDLPMTFSASIPLFHLSKLAREQVTVVLTGEGSDELFAGYGRYPRALFNRRLGRGASAVLPAALRRGLASIAGGSRSGRLADRISRSFLASASSDGALMLEPFADWHTAWRTGLLSRDVPRQAPYGAINELLVPADVAVSPLEALLRYDQRTYLEELLMKQDTMSMAASLESRVPFLDHRLVEWSASIPASAKLSGAIGKALVREAARAHLPKAVVDGPKRGFLVPLGRWLRTVGRASVEHYVRPNDPLFAQPMIERILSEHAGGIDHTARLWRLLAFQVWQRDVLPRLSQSAAAAAASPASVAVHT